MTPVTKAYLPDKTKYKKYIDRIYDTGWLTNNGPLVRELEQRLQEYLGVKHLILVANGSLALQLAYKVLGLKGEAVTTPFSFVATTSTLAWEGLKPVFADIESSSFNIDSMEVRQKLTGHTSAIVPVHVFGNPCDIDAIQSIADKHNLKVIYDAAHAFGVKYKGQSVLNYGDISTLSFHATKLFHTIEGGAIVTNNDELANNARLLTNFGIAGPNSIESLGINAKMSEFEAAMGLCVLDEIEQINEQREEIWHVYQQALAGLVEFQQFNTNANNNFSYAPVLFESEQLLLNVEKTLKNNQVTPRRYFHPSLDTLDYLQATQVCKKSRDVASRILCLPMYTGLAHKEQLNIVNMVKTCL